MGGGGGLAAGAAGEHGNFAFHAFPAGVDDLCFECFGGFSDDWRSGRGRAENDAGGTVEEAPDGPAAVRIWEKHFAGTLLFGPIIPAPEEGKSVAEVGYFNFWIGKRVIFKRI
jgi:hypothetical protein